jgi:16S rRNA (cytidine1402-2'-O)-methyltransferase
MPLFIVATPIGTLGDLSPRAKDVLQTVELIAAEDTRMTRRLLHGVNISAKKIMAVHAHNEENQIEYVLGLAQEEDVALVCDAGTPGISDPGGRLVEAAHERGIPVLSVPGPSALSTALSVSGFPAAPSSFIGFAPKKGRETWVKELLRRPETLVVFESPTRITDLVRRCSLEAPLRSAAMCRELSKRFEEILRIPFNQLAEALQSRERIKGEIVLVIGPAADSKPARPAQKPLVHTHKGLANALAERWGMERREAYAILTDLDKEHRDSLDD